MEHLSDSIIRMRQDRRVNLVGSFKISETPLVFGNGVKRGVRLVDPQVDEKRLSRLLALFDERDRMVGILVDGHLFPGTIERPVDIKSILTR